MKKTFIFRVSTISHIKRESNIVSKQHKLFTVQFDKIAINSLDDKRFIIDTTTKTSLEQFKNKNKNVNVTKIVLKDKKKAYV